MTSANKLDVENFTKNAVFHKRIFEQIMFSIENLIYCFFKGENGLQRLFPCCDYLFEEVLAFLNEIFKWNMSSQDKSNSSTWNKNELFIECCFLGIVMLRCGKFQKIISHDFRKGNQIWSRVCFINVKYSNESDG